MRRTILLIEDNVDDEELTILAFERNRIANEIIVVRDGQEALDFFEYRGVFADRDKSEQPELVLLDLNLPKVSGLDVLKLIRANPTTCLIPVVVMTSSREEEDIISSYKNGANSFVRKPVDFEQFTEAISQLQLYWFVLNERPPHFRSK